MGCRDCQLWNIKLSCRHQHKNRPDQGTGKLAEVTSSNKSADFVENSGHNA